MKGFAKGLLGAAVAVAGLAALPAAAELQFGRMDTGLYLGASVGDAHYRHGCDGAPAGCDNDDIAGRAFVGWQFNRYFGLEFGLAYLGKLEADIPIPGLPTVTATARTRSADLVGVLSYPIRDAFSVYGKAGVARNRFSVSGTVPGLGTFTAGREYSTTLTYGAGVRYNFARNISARAEWQRYHVGVDSGSFVPPDKIDYFSLGLLYGWY